MKQFAEADCLYTCRRPPREMPLLRHYTAQCLAGSWKGSTRGCAAAVNLSASNDHTFILLTHLPTHPLTYFPGREPSGPNDHSFILTYLRTYFTYIPGGESPDHRAVGVLDIFGFEAFETNSLEQAKLDSL